MACINSNEPASRDVPGEIAAVTPVELTGTVAMNVSPTPTVRVTRADGAPIAGTRVTFEVTAGVATVTPRVVETDAAGRATAAWMLGTVAMGYAITATVVDLAPVRFSAVARPGPIARVVAVGGDGQIGAPATALPQPLTAKVEDAFANPIAGAIVSFDVMSGDGAVERLTATSDASGLATSGTWTLGAKVGVQKVRARAGAIDVVFTADTCACSPDAQLVFESIVDRHIYSVGLDGTRLTRLTNAGGNARPRWSPDGRRIAFVRHAANLAGDIYLMDPDGKQVVRRTTGSGLRSAAWSPDGRKLAVSTEGIYYSDIWVISADDDGSSPVHLAADARSPAWSPDGKKIAYIHTSGDDGYDALYVMNADGTGATPLTSPSGGRHGISWSPDGRRIASSKCEAGVCDVFVMNADGSDVRRLTDVGTAQEAAWSPDGGWIAVSLWTYSGRDVTVSLAYIPAEGGAPRVVASDGFHPSWRP